MQLQEYVKSLREAKAIINSAIVISTAEGIVKSHDSNLLECSGGHIMCTKHWAKHFLNWLWAMLTKIRYKSNNTK